MSRAKKPKEGWLSAPCMYVQEGYRCPRQRSDHGFWNATPPNIRASLTVCSEHKDWGEAMILCFAALSDLQLKVFICLAYRKTPEELMEEIRVATDVERLRTSSKTLAT